MKPRILPIGIGDLKVVKQKLARYEAGEIAHIENVMATESRGREHRRLRQIEEVLISEQERTEENKRDLQSTERFELQQETEKTIQSDTKFEAGAEVSASYGPVQIGAYARFSTSQSTTESERNATNYAKEITERSLNRIVERVRQERTTRTLEEFEEKNEHRFENTEGENVSGIYRWVDKYYRAKVINYGKRLFYEFIVPEPAAFYIFSKTNHIKQDVLPEEPERPTHPDADNNRRLRPVHIKRTNYGALISRYGVQGVSPPPPEHIVISRMFAREFQEDQNWAFVDSDLEIPDGYEYAHHAQTLTHGETDDGFQYSIHQSVRHTSVRDGQELSSEFEISNVSGILPIGARGYGVRSLLISIEVTCSLKPEAFRKWQIETFDAIMSEYNKKLLDYEERVAAAQIQEGVEIGGNNPLINRAIEREELKKGCITLWTGLWAGDKNPVPTIKHKKRSEPPDNYPEIRIDNALEISPSIQFLEQAFDWKNITYEFYPPYWSRKKKWLDVYPLEDSDPLFRDFLRAGAARVIVPVHLAATEAVLFYQMTGKIWIDGGEIPFFMPASPSAEPGFADLEAQDEMDEELAVYNAYLAELSGEDAVDDIEKEVEISADDPDAWLIKVPTTLVWLQEDATLPDFEA